MFKQLLSLAAAAVVSLGASAGVLWQSDTDEGVLVDWGQPCVALSADDVVAAIQPGDYIKVTTVSVDPENGWPQVALFGQYGGWPPLTNEGVGGKSSYPYVSSFSVTYDLYASISTEGLSVSGNGAYVSKVEVESSGIEVGPNTVWFGNKECGWGNGVSLPAALFENVKVGEQLVFYTSDQSYQVILGGWSGLNLPCYNADNIPNVSYEDGVAKYTMIEKYATNNTYTVIEDNVEVEKEYDVFALMKENGVIMHGTTTITRIDFNPVDVVVKEIAEAHKADLTQIKEWDEALKTLKANYPFYASVEDINATFTEIEETIKNYSNKVDELYDAAGDSWTYTSPLTSAVVTEMNEKIIGLGADCAEVVAAIEDAYAADEAQIQEWYKALNDLEEEYPFFENVPAIDDAFAAIAQAITAKYEDIAAAQSAANQSGVYESPFTGAVVTEMNEMIINAMSACEELVATIIEAYDADVAQIKEWTDALAELEEEYPFFDKVESINATCIEIAQALHAYNDEVAKALETASENGTYESPFTSAIVTEMNEKIMATMADCEEVVAAITEAYDADIATIQEWTNALSELEEEYPFFANVTAIDDACAEIAQAIFAKYEEVAEAQSAANQSGVYESPLTGAVVTEMNEKIINTMSACEELVAAIMEAYDADVAQINEWAAAVAELEEEYPFFEDVEDINAAFAEISKAIQDLYFQVEDALMAANESGEYESPLTGSVITNINEQIIAVMAACEEYQQTTGINSIGADAADTMYFGINGQRIMNPAAGQTVIKVANGKVSKVVIK